MSRRKENWSNRYPGWALITGASSGLGACFARALAARGMPVALAARRQNRLEAVADKIRREFDVEAITISVELTNDGFLDEIVEGLEGREVGMLVNNAGFGLAMPFHQADPDRLDKMVRLNCLAPTLLARRFLPPMIDRFAGLPEVRPLDPAIASPGNVAAMEVKEPTGPVDFPPQDAPTKGSEPTTPLPMESLIKNRTAGQRGAHILLGSVAGFQPVGHFAVYGATKTYNMMLGEALWAEQRQLGIDTLVAAPGVTATEFQEVSGTHPAGRIASPEKVVEGSLRALGRTPTYVPGWDNKIVSLAPRFLPRKWAARLTEKVAVRLLSPEAREQRLRELIKAGKR